MWQSFIYRNAKCTKNCTPKMCQVHKIMTCRKITQIDQVQYWKSTTATSFSGKTFPYVLSTRDLQCHLNCVHYTVYNRCLILWWTKSSECNKYLVLVKWTPKVLVRPNNIIIYLFIAQKVEQMSTSEIDFRTLSGVEKILKKKTEKNCYIN